MRHRASDPLGADVHADCAVPASSKSLSPITTTGPEQPTSDPWLTVQGAALHLSVCKKTIYRWISDGTLHCGKHGKILRIRRSHVDALFEADSTATESDGLGAFITNQVKS